MPNPLEKTPMDHPVKKNQRGIGNWVGVLTLISLLSLAVLLPAGCSNEEAAGGDSQSGTETEAIKIDKGTVNQEDVENMILRKVGTVDYAGDPIIRQVALTEEADGTVVTISVGRPPSCHPGQVVGYITEMARGFMSSLFLYDDVSRVEVSLYGTTDNYDDKNVLAAKTVMTREDADKIDDWFAFDENTIAEMTTDYWVEPVIYTNWQQFGSTAITDPGLLEQANQ